MNLVLVRKFRGAAYTIGRLYVDGVPFCDTLEDPDRGLTSLMSPKEISARKVHGETAIPTGYYDVSMSFVSPKFSDRSWAWPYGGIVPRLLDVPGFDGILIHPGNTQADTMGCILPGFNYVKGRVVDSAITYLRLMDQYLMPAHLRGEQITISIRYEF